MSGKRRNRREQAEARATADQEGVSYQRGLQINRERAAQNGQVPQPPDPVAPGYGVDALARVADHLDGPGNPVVVAPTDKAHLAVGALERELDRRDLRYATVWPDEFPLTDAQLARLLCRETAGVEPRNRMDALREFARAMLDRDALVVNALGFTRAQLETLYLHCKHPWARSRDRQGPEFGGWRLFIVGQTVRVNGRKVDFARNAQRAFPEGTNVRWLPDIWPPEPGAVRANAWRYPRLFAGEEIPSYLWLDGGWRDPEPFGWSDVDDGDRLGVLSDIVAAGARPGWEFVFPAGLGPANDRLMRAYDDAARGDRDGAVWLLERHLADHEADLDGWAQLSGWALESGDVDRALALAARGVRLGEWALPEPFDGTMVWGVTSNRPFQRCLFSYAAALEAAGDLDLVRTILEALLWLNPSDNIGARYPLALLEGGSSTPIADWEREDEEIASASNGGRARRIASPAPAWTYPFFGAGQDGPALAVSEEQYGEVAPPDPALIDDQVDRDELEPVMPVIRRLVAAGKRPGWRFSQEAGVDLDEATEEVYSLIAAQHFEPARRRAESALARAEEGLPRPFSGAIAYGILDNRPFHRLLFSYALTLAAGHDTERLRAALEAMLWLNPQDNLGARQPLAALLAGDPQPFGDPFEWDWGEE